VRDLAEFLNPELEPLRRHIGPGAVTRIALQKPCTLQHGVKLKDQLEQLLSALGAELLPVAEAHLCCGSAGTYSLLQPQLAQQLRTRKLDHLLATQPQMIVSANIGCIAHLGAGTTVPVRHWIEWVDERIITK
jgi:glycolate oxidase iron-sulfur subunit